MEVSFNIFVAFGTESVADESVVTYLFVFVFVFVSLLPEAAVPPISIWQETLIPVSASAFNVTFPSLTAAPKFPDKVAAAEIAALVPYQKSQDIEFFSGEKDFLSVKQGCTAFYVND